jgi:hypothetical protein
VRDLPKLSPLENNAKTRFETAFYTRTQRAPSGQQILDHLDEQKVAQSAGQKTRTPLWRRFWKIVPNRTGKYGVYTPYSSTLTSINRFPRLTTYRG